MDDSSNREASLRFPRMRHTIQRAFNLLADMFRPVVTASDEMWFSGARPVWRVRPLISEPVADIQE